MNIIGLDIGGTKITGLVFNGKKQSKSQTLPTPKSLPSFEATLIKLVDNLSRGEKISGLGIGMAGIIDHKKNLVKYSPNLKFIENFGFNNLFPHIKKIKLDNDANCFASAEASLGQGRNLKNFVALTLGTGIGGGLVSEGKVYLGARGMAGELGAMLLDAKNSIEYYFQQARDRSDYKKMGELIGILLVNIYKLLDPEAVILGGGVTAKNHARFLPKAMEMLAARYAKSPIKFNVLISKIENAGALGAALLHYK